MLFKNFLSAILVIAIALSSAPSKAQEIDGSQNEKRHELFIKVSTAYQDVMQESFPYNENNINDKSLNKLKESLSNIYTNNMNARLLTSFMYFSTAAIAIGIGISSIPYSINTAISAAQYILDRPTSDFANILIALSTTLFVTTPTSILAFFCTAKGGDSLDKASGDSHNREKLLSL